MVSAQAVLTATLSTPQIEDYPKITTFLNVWDAEGRFITDLTPENINLLEDGQALSVDSLEAINPGAQFVVAINPGAPFAIRNAQGISRYDFIVENLAAWANGLPTGDNLSLIMNNGPNEHHLTDPAAWVQLLENAPKEHRTAVQNLQVLSQAIAVASDPTRTPGMGRGVLFITPNPEGAAIPVFENLAALARQAGVRIFVWMVANEDTFTSEGAVALQDLAQSTGGNSFAFSGGEAFPDVNLYLEQLRQVYRLSFTSQAASSGAHTLSAQVVVQGAQADTQVLTYEINLLPPAPVLVSPPSEIIRTAENPDDPQGTIYLPEAQTLEILIEFPDGYNRELSRTILYVDGQIVAENTQSPYDRFTWNLAPYRESGRHTIQVEAVDVLGYSSLSIETPIEMILQLTAPATPILQRGSSVLVAAIVMLAAAILILVLFLSMRAQTYLKPRPVRTQIHKAVDPVYQTIPEGEDTTGRLRLANWASQLQTKFTWPQRSTRSEAAPVAFLERIFVPGDLETLTPSKPIPITSHEITLGADPKQATLVLDEPTVDPLHARLHYHRTTGFFLRDQKSIAGTWLNYKEVSDQAPGARLQDGDLIHIGRVCFRFVERHVTQPPPPEVTSRQSD